MFVVEVKLEMCSAPHQLYGWPTHICAFFGAISEPP